MRDLIKNIILDQKQLTWDEHFIRRDIPDLFHKSDDIIVISGVRRCGKSTLMQQIRMDHAEHDFYFNFDDERLVNFTLDHFQMLQEVLIELYGEQKTWYFDEIQNITGWERFVRRLHDYGNKIYLTGSNATMLSRELGTHLTGRYLRFELYPFSFAEFLRIKGQNRHTGDASTKGKATLNRFFGEYLKSGGFPQYIATGNELYLKSLYESILYRDVMVRNNLTNEHEIAVLVNYLAANISNLVSYNNLRGITGIKNATTVKKYVDLLKDSYLLFPVSKFDYSVRKQVQNPKKVYFIDPALALKLGFSFSENRGRLLENLVYIELRRRTAETWYYNQGNECDFIIRSGNKVTEVIQVCWSVSDPEVRKRELSGLSDAMDKFGLEHGTVITREEKENFFHNGHTVKIIPITEWLLDDG